MQLEQKKQHVKSYIYEKKITLRNKNWLKGVTGWVKLKKKILELVGGGGFYEKLKFIENLKSLAI